MQEKLSSFIGGLNFEELTEFKKNFSLHSGTLKQAVEEKLALYMQNNDQLCTVCMGEMEKTSVHNYTLIFGPQDFRKKAIFCGPDCLEYFIKQLKELRVCQKVKQRTQ